jgi:integrase/recombinase XerD
MDDGQAAVVYEGEIIDALLHLLQKDGSYLNISVPNNILEADCFILKQWLDSKRSKLTQEAYGRDISEFYQFEMERQQKNTIRVMGLNDLQEYASLLIRERQLKESSQARKLACVRSLFSFASKLQYIPVNTAALLTLPAVDDELAQRILPEQDFHSMIEEEEKIRDRAILMMLYYCGLRAFEVCSLEWKHFTPRQYDQNFGATVTIHGKGDATRHIPVQLAVWSVLQILKQEMSREGYTTSPDAYVFQADPEQRTNVPTGTAHMHKNTIYKIVKRVAKRAGIAASVSAHWFRHGHATYAQVHGASAVLVQKTLGHKSLATTTKYSHIISGDGSGRYL